MGSTGCLAEGTGMSPAAGLPRRDWNYTLVSLALPPGQVNGSGAAVSPGYIHSVRKHFISHKPLVPREMRWNCVTRPAQICHWCWLGATPLLRVGATSLVRVGSKNMVSLFNLFLYQAAFPRILKNTVACMWLLSLSPLSGRQGQCNL